MPTMKGVLTLKSKSIGAILNGYLFGFSVLKSFKFWFFQIIF